MHEGGFGVPILWIVMVCMCSREILYPQLPSVSRRSFRNEFNELIITLPYNKNRLSTNIIKRKCAVLKVYRQPLWKIPSTDWTYGTDSTLCVFSLEQHASSICSEKVPPLREKCLLHSSRNRKYSNHLNNILWSSMNEFSVQTLSILCLEWYVADIYVGVKKLHVLMVIPESSPPTDWFVLSSLSFVLLSLWSMDRWTSTSRAKIRRNNHVPVKESVLKR